MHGIGCLWASGEQNIFRGIKYEDEHGDEHKERERKENEAQKRINKVFFIFSYIMLYDITLWVA